MIHLDFNRVPQLAGVLMFLGFLPQLQALQDISRVALCDSQRRTLMEMKLAPDSLATALASSVLPQPAHT